MNKKPPLFPNGTIAFVSTQLNGKRVDARIDPRLLKKNKNKKEGGRGEKWRKGTEKIHTQKLAMLRNDRPRVFAWTSRTSRDNVAGESVFAPGCPRQIFGADALWVSPGGGQLRRRGQSMLAISCSLRGAVMPGTIVIDKS